jgi:hypothetical protein
MTDVRIDSELPSQGEGIWLPLARVCQTTHYTELPPAKADDPLAIEWDFYRREATRLLAEGNEGRWVLVKGEEIVGIWGAMEDAELAGLERYPDKRFLIHQVKEREPLLQIAWRFRECLG